MVEPVIQRAVPASMLRGQRQIDQRPHRPVRAQQRLGQLELRIRPRAQAGVEAVSEPAQLGDRLDSDTLVVHAVHRGLRSIMDTLGENTIFRRPPRVATTRRRTAGTGRSPTPQVKRQAKAARGNSATTSPVPNPPPPPSTPPTRVGVSCLRTILTLLSSRRWITAASYASMSPASRCRSLIRS